MPEHPLAPAINSTGLTASLSIADPPLGANCSARSPTSASSSSNMRRNGRRPWPPPPEPMCGRHRGRAQRRVLVAELAGKHAPPGARLPARWRANPQPHLAAGVHACVSRLRADGFGAAAAGGSCDGCAALGRGTWGPSLSVESGPRHSIRLSRRSRGRRTPSCFPDRRSERCCAWWKRTGHPVDRGTRQDSRLRRGERCVPGFPRRLSSGCGASSDTLGPAQERSGRFAAWATHS